MEGFTEEVLSELGIRGCVGARQMEKGRQGNHSCQENSIGKGSWVCL